MRFKPGMWLKNNDPNSLSYKMYMYLVELRNSRGLRWFDVIIFDEPLSKQKAKFIKEWGIPKERQHWIKYRPDSEDCRLAIMALFGDEK